ncbi:MAG TPA: DUF1905 domain-containing protein [Saprospiraceae bacterium]|nr:DUF1905 domain-containing protein [Saprospiraceae bacterium]
MPQWAAASIPLRQQSRRAVCRLHERIEWPCALLPRGDGSYLITVNKKTQAALGVQPGSVVQVEIWPDESEYGLPMPEELAELMTQDEEAHRLLHALTPGKTRTLLYIIAQPKSSDLRLQRALVIVNHLKANGGKVDYKRLNHDLREG